MSFDKERETIELLFMDFTAAPVKFDNVPLVPSPLDGIYVAPKILNGESTRRSIGANARKRHFGVIAVQIFGVEGVGTKRQREVADAVVDLLEDKTFTSGTDTIRTFDSSLRPVGSIGNNTTLATVMTPFERDEDI